MKLVSKKSFSRHVIQRMLVLCVLFSQGAAFAETITAKMTDAEFNAIWEKRKFPEDRKSGDLNYQVFPMVARSDLVRQEIKDNLVGQAVSVWDRNGDEYSLVYDLSTALTVIVKADKNKRITDIIPDDNFWVTATGGAGAEATFRALTWKMKRYSLVSMMVLNNRKRIRVYYCGQGQGDVLDCPRGVTGWYRKNGELLLDASSIKIPARVSNDDLRMHVLPVGAGNCIAIECPGGNDALVVDCGSKGSGVLTRDAINMGIVNPATSNYEIKAMPYIVGTMYNLLQDKNMIDVVLTHSDEDHYGYYNDIFSQAWFNDTANKPIRLASKLGRLYVGGRFDLYRIGSVFDAYANFVTPSPESRLYAMGTTADEAHQHFNLNPIANAVKRWRATPVWTANEINTEVAPPRCGSASVEILAVNEDKDNWVTTSPARVRDEKNKGINDALSNQRSAIVRVSYKGKSIILPGDATEKPLLATLDKIGPSTIVVAPHHGTDTDESHNESWIKKVNPEYLVISHGSWSIKNDEFKLKFGHPRKAAYERYARGSRLLDSGQEHSIELFEDVKTFPPIEVKNKKHIYSTHFDGAVLFTIKADASVEANCYGPFGELYSDYQKRSSLAGEEDEPEFSHWCSPLRR